MTSRARQGRGPGRPVLENLRNAGPLLREGEVTRTHRVRASQEVHDWFAAMSAGERGVLLARARAGEGSADSRPDPMSISVVQAPSRPDDSLQGVVAVRVISAHLSQQLRNDLRWSSDRYARLEALLAQGPVLRSRRVNSKTVWRTVENITIRSDTVAMLLQAGNVAVDEP